MHNDKDDDDEDDDNVADNDDEDVLIMQFSVWKLRSFENWNIKSQINAQ